jgi:hypothetical protein
MELRDGPDKPARKKLYPSREVFEVFITDRIKVWKNELTYDLHNIVRKRAGGRDDTWAPEKFFEEVMKAIQYPSENPYLVFAVRVIDEEFLSLGLLERKDNVVTNILKPCDFLVTDPDITGHILSLIISDEKSHVYFYVNHGDDLKLRAIVNNGGLHYLDREGDGWSLLQVACYNGHIDIVRYLLQRGADINLQSRDGKDPLMCTILGGHFNIFKVLVDAGAILRDENAYEDGTESHLTYAVACHRKDVVNYILRPGGPLISMKTAAHGVRNKKPVDQMFTTLPNYPYY